MKHINEHPKVAPLATTANELAAERDRLQAEHLALWTELNQPGQSAPRSALDLATSALSERMPRADRRVEIGERLQEIDLRLRRVQEASLVISGEMAEARVHASGEICTAHAPKVAALAEDVLDAVERLIAANENLDGYFANLRSAGVQIDDRLRSLGFTGTPQPGPEGIKALREIARRLAQGIAAAKSAR